LDLFGFRIGVQRQGRMGDLMRLGHVSHGTAGPSGRRSMIA
jgi:hypothetical protein